MLEIVLFLFPAVQILTGVVLIIFTRQILEWTDKVEEKIAGKMDGILPKPFLLNASRSSAAYLNKSGYFTILIWVFRILGILAVASGIYYIVSIMAAFNS